MRHTICKKIKELRKQHACTQQEVADSLNMSQNAYSMLEAGHTKIDIERLQQIAEFYKISVNNLFEELFSNQSYQ